MIIERLDNARAELHMKTKAIIDTETAATWGARAVVAWEKYVSTGDIKWLVMSAEFQHEAIEHAACGVPGALDRIRAELSQCGLTP